MKLEIYLKSTIPLNEELWKLLREQIFYIDSRIRDSDLRKSSGQSTENFLTLTFEREIDEKELKEITNNTIALFEKTEQSFKRVDTPLIFETEFECKFQQDPHEELRSSRQIIENSPGVIIYQGNLLRIIRGLDQLFKEFALSRGAIEQEYPTTVPARSLASNGYLASFPQHAIFATPIHPDFKSLQDLVESSKADSQEPRICLASSTLEQPRQVLAPTVCYHCFEGLRDKDLNSSELHLITAIAKCHRHEYKTTNGLERLQTFTMREIIFYGSEKQVVAFRDEVLEFSKALLEKWKLKMRVIGANDPFFAIDAGKKRSYQSFLGLKQELQLFLPYKNKWLAVGSFNNHRDTLTRAYGINNSDQESQMFSGCVGYGYERMALGILAQVGHSTLALPEELQRSV